jgi:chromate transporter
LALILPCFTVATIVSFFKKAFQDNKYVKNALFGIRAMVVGMILTAVLSFADGSVLTSSVKNLWKKGAALPGICWQGVVIFIVIAVIELKWKLNTILSITIAGLLGLALFSI